jgi:TRAP-type C4-dicarboxylate transport system substrate-binding protein
MKAGKVAEKYMTKEAAGLDTTMEKAYKKAGVKLAYMTKSDFDAWLEIAKKTSYKNFATKVPGGQKLIDQALAVK